MRKQPRNAVVINTTITDADAKHVIKNLGRILNGKQADIHGIRPVFYGTMARYLYAKIHQACIEKAYGGTDELGNSWEQLSEATIKRRLEKWFVHRHLLSANLHINRVDDTLLRSLKPGVYNEGGYHPTANQYFNYGRGKLVLGSKLKHASHVHSRRPLWPDNMSEWIVEATRISLERVIEHIKRRTR